MSVTPSNKRGRVEEPDGDDRGSIVDPDSSSQVYIFPSLTWVVNEQILNLPPHVWETRLIRLIKLSYNLSYNFSRLPSFNKFIMDHAAEFLILQTWIGQPIPRIPSDDQVIQNTIATITAALRSNYFQNDEHRILLNYTLMLAPANVAGHEVTYTWINDNRPRVRVAFANIPIEFLQLVIDHYHNAAINYADANMRTIFRRSFDDLFALFARVRGTSVNPYQAVSDVLQNYLPAANMNNYPGNLITLFTPARYYVLGFGLIGQSLFLANPLPPHMSHNFSFFLSQQDISNVQNAVLPWNPHLPLGPGGLAWMLIGLQDYITNILTSGQQHAFIIGPNHQRTLDVTITYMNNAQITLHLPQNSGSIAVNRPSFYTARANVIFALMSNVFNGHVADFYKENVIEDANGGIKDILFSLNSPMRQQMNVVGSGIDGSNIYWEQLLIPGDGKFKGLRSQFVLFKSRDEEKNIYLHGCVQRAVNCVCKINTHDSPVFCSCPLPSLLESVDLEHARSLCKANDDKFLIFVIYISKLGENGKTTKTLQFFHLGKNYFSREDGKVLYISMPCWKKVQGHCALWLPDVNQKVTDDPGYNRFIMKSRFNVINNRITGKELPCICPICGDYYQNKALWGHYLRHSGKEVCPFCGFSYENGEELDEHVKYHCKKLTVGSTIILNDELIHYREPKDTGLWICVYADLESAILPSKDGVEREHENILVGWVDDYNKETRIARDIKDFLNALVKLPTTDVIIYFHNGEGYDFHFIVRDLCTCRKGFVRDFSLVGDSGQKIRFFSVKYRNKNLHFRDSFAFVSESLEKWIKSSLQSGCPFMTFKNTFDEFKQSILLRKNPFPYNAIQCKSDLDRPIGELIAWAQCDIAEELFCYKYNKEELIEFSHWLQENYKQCSWKTVLDYYVDYLKCDVSQLKDVMDFFADNARAEFGINIHSYYGTPSLTWAAWLRQNRFVLEPITEPKHYDVINSTIRGGQTGVFTRYYDQESEGGAMFDLDCNSLYATVMLKFEYPCHDWKEETIPDIKDLEDYINILHSKKRSAFIELDMVVLENEYYFDYLPVASKRTIKGAYNYEAMQFYDTENPETMYFTGLTQVVGLHEHYCCHSRNLLWYLQHKVIEVKKVWFVLSGIDEPVFRDYVQSNLDKRREFADDPIKKMLYKLLNNSLYGKTYEDETQRCDYYLEPTDEIDKDDKITIRRIINEMGDWTLYEGAKTQFHVNKPVYLGACITEFSKLWMYQFYYDKIKNKFPDARVYYTDTDALTILFPSKIRNLMDLATELNTEDEQIIDTSNFDTIPTDTRHTLHNNEPGLFKSETGDHCIKRFIGLRAKTYIMVCDNDSIKMSVKGCPMKEKERLKWEDFKRVLFSKGEGYKIDYDAIRSKYHLVKSVKLTKIVLSADDRKRYILPDKIHTYPLFSKFHLEAIQL